MSDPPAIVRSADIAPQPWRNGGGVTRELLAWPDTRDWLLRISVAEIHSSGPFSIYPGVDRWLAVLDGGGVRLETGGSEAAQLSAHDRCLHAFSGDAATHCTALGAPSRDFNIMARRSGLRLHQQPVGRRLESRAEAVGLFVVNAMRLSDGSGSRWPLSDMTLAWWPNPKRAGLSLTCDTSEARGWWFEVHTIPRPTD